MSTEFTPFTPPTPHTRVFVSGSSPSALPDVDAKDPNQPWWMTHYGQFRLAAEIKAMDRFPDFRLSRFEGQLCWRGRFRSSLSRRRYLIRVTYPAQFPDYPPEVTIEGHRFPAGVPHLLEGNRPCLFAPVMGSRHGYDPARTTAATLVGWTALWIHAYETWRATGTWPGREA